MLAAARARDARLGPGPCSVRPEPAGSTTRGRCCAPPTSSSPTPGRTRSPTSRPPGARPSSSPSRDRTTSNSPPRARCTTPRLAVVRPSWPAAGGLERRARSGRRAGRQRLGALEHRDGRRAGRRRSWRSWHAHRGDHDRGRAPRPPRPPARRARTRPEQHVVVAMGDGEAERCRRLVGDTSDVIGVGVPPDGLPLARARNAGARRALDAGADLLVFLDVDCIPGAALAAALRAAAAARPRAAVRTGRLPAARAASGYPAATCTRSPRRTPRGRSRRRTRSSAAAITRCSGRCPSRSPPRPGARSAGSARTTSATAARTPTSARSPPAPASTSAGSAAPGPTTSTTRPSPRPSSTSTDILRNAALFHRRWGWWPMRGWLTAFAERGLARHDPAADRWVLAATE